ncbi:hypothetical protein KAR91_62465 [Candidatus Pacearchaeota archaeon]|nr:hypothetical protein [Candidatus Pacearchaeota archaeon]
MMTLKITRICDKCGHKCEIEIDPKDKDCYSTEVPFVCDGCVIEDVQRSIAEEIDNDR